MNNAQPTTMNATKFTKNTTKVDQSPNVLGEYQRNWTTRRIKAQETLDALGLDNTGENVSLIQDVRITQEGSGNWAAYSDATGRYISGGVSLKECWTYLLKNHILNYIQE
jgi:propanediol dehydratase small subunit